MAKSKKVAYKERLREMLVYSSLQRMREYFLAKAGSLEYFKEESLMNFVKSVMSLTDFMGYEDPDSALRDLDEDVLNGYVRHLRERGNSTATQKLRIAHVKRWTRSNDVDLKWDKVVLPKVRPVVNDRAPTKTELRLIMSYAPTWMIPAILALTSSGLRVGSLIGLKRKHLDLDSFPDIGIIEVPPKLAKGGIGYFTAVNLEAREALEKSFVQRGQRGEMLGPESPLIKSPRNIGNTTYSSFAQAWKRCLKNAGLDEKSGGVFVLHLHTLRKFFRSQVEGILTKSIRETLMGHLNSEYLDQSYLRMPLKKLAEEYRKTVPALTVYEDVQSDDYQKKQFLLTAQMLFPNKAKMISEILARHRTVEKASHEIQEFINPPETNKREAKIVSSEEEMVELVSNGWDLERELNGGSFLLKRDLVSSP